MLAAAPQVHAQTRTVASAGLDEIVVTARRREEGLLDTPIAITAITSEDIVAQGIRSFGDIVQATPGINISNTSSGRSDRSFQTITLRALNPSSTLTTLVSTFIDGAPVASSIAVNAVLDPERVEILRGPQSVYFGRNTFAGAVNVVNKLPGDEFGGSVSLMGGSRDNYDVSGSIDGPLFSDKLGFRLSGRTYSRDGSYDNAVSPDETLGDQSTQSVSLHLTADPTERLSIKVFGLYSEDDDGPTADGVVSAYELRANAGVTNIPALTGSTAGTVILPGQSNCMLNGFVSSAPVAGGARRSRPFICGAAPGLPAGFSPAQNTLNDSLVQASLANPDFRVRSPSEGTDGYGLVHQYAHVHLNVDYEFGESGFTLSSLTGYNDEGFSELDDLDNYDNSLITNPANPTGANSNLRRAYDFPFVIERELYDFSQELRLSFDRGDAFSGLIGASYLSTKFQTSQINLNSEIVGVPGVGAIARSQSAVAAPQETETTSIFFGAAYEFSDRWTLNLEGRFQRDKAFGYAGSSAVIIPPNNALGLPAGRVPPYGLIVEDTYDNFLPRVILQYEFSDDLMGYASWAKAVSLNSFPFNLAAITNEDPVVRAQAALLGLGPSVTPEKLTNYELGLKGRFLDDRMTAQLAIYRGDWTDQINSLLTTVTNQMGEAQLVGGSINTGDTVVQGVEVDVVFNPVPNLEVSIAAALNDSEYGSFTNNAVSQLTGVIDEGFDGNQLPATSKYSANLGLQYGTALGFIDDAAWFARADVSWKDKQYLDGANITWIDDRTVVNLRAGIARGPLALDVFVLNAFDDDNYVSIGPQGVLSPGFPLAAPSSYLLLGLPDLRTYGARVSYRF